jgi:hypothetical protein
MNDIKDYLGHEIHEGDVVLYSNKRGEFKEGVITSTKPLFFADSFLFKKYKNGSKTWTDICCSKSKFTDELINLTTLGIRERELI